jgi:SAM-dependent methyltransferase
MSFWRFLFFNLWYTRRPPWDGGISPAELLDFLNRHPPGRALDLGCGTGTNIITLAKHGWQATGVDFAWRAIWIARRKAKQAGVRANFRIGDVTHLTNLHGSFDLILDMGCFHSLPPQGRQAYRANLRRLLAPGGTFLLYSFLHESSRDGPGLGEDDINNLSAGLELVSRQEGSDRVGGRRSAWLTFQQPPAPAESLH